MNYIIYAGRDPRNMLAMAPAPTKRCAKSVAKLLIKRGYSYACAVRLGRTEPVIVWANR